MSTVPDPPAPPATTDPLLRLGAHTRYRIAAYRAHHHMTQAQVAGRAGITREYLSMIENGRRAADKHSLLAAIAHALGVDVTALTTTRPGGPATDQHSVDRATILRLALRDIHASIGSGPDDHPTIVLSDGVLRVELTTDPDEHPKQDRNAAVHIIEIIAAYLRGRPTCLGNHDTTGPDTEIEPSCLVRPQ